MKKNWVEYRTLSSAMYLTVIIPVLHPTVECHNDRHSKFITN